MDVVGLLRRLGVFPASREAFRVFASCLRVLLGYCGGLRELAGWGAPVLGGLCELSSGDLRLLEAEASGSGLSVEECQLLVQRLVPRAERKRYAVYYTTGVGVRFMSAVACSYLRGRGGVVLADPFLGSGVALAAVARELGDRVEAVWGVEPLPLPALVAYTALVDALGGRRELVRVVVGDAFDVVPRRLPPGELPKADVILTNPPFTRWMLLDSRYRRWLLQVVEGLGYGRYVTRREASLQALSLFLCDYALRDGGLLASVLPASTFYTIYGRGVKRLLKERYRVLALAEGGGSFSEGSGFKEVILAAVKGGGGGATAFIKLSEKRAPTASMASGSRLVDLKSAPWFLDLNWLAFFEGELRDVVVKLVKQGVEAGMLRPWRSVLGRWSLIRGIEMYGPDFFFIPNRYWRLVEDDESYVRLESKWGAVKLDKSLLVKALRKPSLYSWRIEAEVDTYMLAIPPAGLRELPRELREYVEWGARSGVAAPAIRAYGELWYSHVYRQVKAKKPFGHVFIPDKVDLLFRRRGVFANYTREETAASKNFYIARCSLVESKLITAWLNSTIFLAMLVLLGRKISETWTRLLESDYLELPIPDLSRLRGEQASEILEQLSKVMQLKLPPMWAQLGEGSRRSLDIAVAKALRVKSPEDAVEELYRALAAALHARGCMGS